MRLVSRAAVKVDCLLLTCEHGGSQVPALYKKLFRGEAAVLRTHRGLDIGALAVARLLGKALNAPLFYSTTTRLLIDLNRSLHHKQLYSEFSGELSDAAKAAVCARYYTPYRSNVEAWIRAQTKLGRRVLHLSVHSFTPKLNGEVRKAELAYLYDPQRRPERSLALQLQSLTGPEAKSHGWRVRRNYPYHGAADGLTTSLREMFPASSYVGLEVEMNQKILATQTGQRQMAAVLGKALRSALSHSEKR